MIVILKTTFKLLFWILILKLNLNITDCITIYNILKLNLFYI